MERAPVIRHRQTATGLALLLGLVLVFGFVAAYRIYKPSSTIEGIIWQPSNDYTTPKGAWHLLGAHTLMVQWLIVDDHVWTATEAEVLLPIDVDWLEVLSQPWAQSRIWGLAGRYSINMARFELENLLQRSQLIPPFVPAPPRFWYAPFELSPDITDEAGVQAYLGAMPRPLMVSIYGGADMEPDEFADWADELLPKDATILLQDEVGVARLEPEEARARADALVARRGYDSVIVILEAFQERARDTDSALAFEPAPLQRLHRQLSAYNGLKIYVFSARHFGAWQVIGLKLLYGW